MKYLILILFLAGCGSENICKCDCKEEFNEYKSALDRNDSNIVRYRAEYENCLERTGNLLKWVD